MAGTRRPRLAIAAGCVAVFLAGDAGATPTGNVWAPSTPGVQGYRVLHLTYDTYLTADSLYPVDLGVTLGALPWDALQLELGADVLYPTLDAGGDRVAVPVVFNGKIGGAEDLYFPGQPAWAAGIYNVGLEANVNDYNLAYLVVGKSGLPYVGSISIGAYYGLNPDLLRSSDGDVNRAGFLAGWFSPAIEVPLLDRLHVAADVQTGNNAVGAAAAAVYVYFTPLINLVTGPVVFFEPPLQPNANRWGWTVQLDIDIELAPSP